MLTWRWLDAALNGHDVFGFTLLHISPNAHAAARLNVRLFSTAPHGAHKYGPTAWTQPSAGNHPARCRLPHLAAGNCSRAVLERVSIGFRVARLQARRQCAGWGPVALDWCMHGHAWHVGCLSTCLVVQQHCLPCQEQPPNLSLGSDTLMRLSKLTLPHWPPTKTSRRPDRGSLPPVRRSLTAVQWAGRATIDHDPGSLPNPEQPTQHEHSTLWWQKKRNVTQSQLAHQGAGRK